MASRPTRGGVDLLIDDSAWEVSGLEPMLRQIDGALVVLAMHVPSGEHRVWAMLNEARDQLAEAIGQVENLDDALRRLRSCAAIRRARAKTRRNGEERRKAERRRQYREQTA